MNLCRFDNQNRHAFELLLLGDKRGSEAPSFQVEIGRLLRKQNVCHSDSLQYLVLNVFLNVAVNTTEKEVFLLKFNSLKI